MGRMLVIDDDESVCEFVVESARQLGLDCISARNMAALREVSLPDITVILLDLMMPEADGVEVLRMLAEQKSDAQIVLMSGLEKQLLESAERLARARGLSVKGYIKKPFRLTELEELLKRYDDRQPDAVAVVEHSAPNYIQDDDLRVAIARQEFVVYFQPQIELATMKVVGVEALARWQHPEWGLIYPDRFIPRLESLRLIDELAWIVARCAMSELWQFADQEGALLGVSLNVAAQSLLDLEFPNILGAIAREHDVPIENVILEVTETALVTELVNTLDVLTRLRMKNVKISIDDFGTGYSMMQQLQNVPATELKIDKGFVQNIYNDDRSRVMVVKIIEMGQDLGMKVVAEGVETEEQLGFLRSRGCDIVQGYLFSRPQPASQMATWIKLHRQRRLA